MKECVRKFQVARFLSTISKNTTSLRIAKNQAPPKHPQIFHVLFRPLFYEKNFRSHLEKKSAPLWMQQARVSHIFLASPLKGLGFRSHSGRSFLL